MLVWQRPREMARPPDVSSVSMTNENCNVKCCHPKIIAITVRPYCVVLFNTESASHSPPPPLCLSNVLSTHSTLPASFVGLTSLATEVTY